MSSRLGELIAVLEATPPDRVSPIGIVDPQSWRGSYDELAFQPAPPMTAAAMLAVAKSALGMTVYGYKGGEYEISEWSPVHLSFDGRSDDYFPLVALASPEAVKAKMRADDEPAFIEAFEPSREAREEELGG